MVGRVSTPLGRLLDPGLAIGHSFMSTADDGQNECLHKKGVRDGVGV